MDSEKKGMTPEALVGAIILGAMVWGCCMVAALFVGALR
jgi:hypothetical protein